MIRKIFAWLIVVMAFGISFYFYKELPSELPAKFANLEGAPSDYAPKNIVLFIIPFTMVITTLSLLFVSLFRLHSEVVKRLDKGLGYIALVLNIVLLILHCSIIYIGLGNQFNILLLLPIIVGMVFVITGNTLPRFQLKASERTNSLKKETYNVWNEVSRSVSYILFFGGIVMLLSVLLPQSLIFVGFLIILFITFFTALIFFYMRSSRSAN
ncbi:DUF1648 domain-containing protein [Cytobacillus purgationiresistens]|uniref:Membrane protein n=1 Tax=Cytobacillus purgationiresistens TaxID=863449 RepID=A0ABU0AR88_9BACI|nr:DUF1648 domain-containing protein [Cytobacillus purgationiresistens]MDQ0273789.1 putative membrane protein [Cytobacillus purgationiresistens]